MQLTELGGHLDTLLDASRLKDYCPNGLQVEGRAEVRRVLCGVTASQALLDLAATGRMTPSSFTMACSGRATTVA